MAQLLHFLEAVSRIKSIRNAAKEQDDVKAPGWLLLALKGRKPWELWASVVSLPFLRQVRLGDGHPVVVFPGLATGALYAVADRLAHPEGEWQRFDRDGVKGLKKMLYLDAVRKPRFGVF